MYGGDGDALRGEGIPRVSARDVEQTTVQCEGLPCRVPGDEVHRDQEGGEAHQDGGGLQERDETELYHRVGPQ